MSWLSLLKAIPAILALVSAVVGLIRAARDRKAGRDEATIEGLEQATDLINKMATIAASPVTDEEIERRMEGGTF